MTIELDQLPMRLTPMQAIAWVATRDPVGVLRASLDEDDCSGAMAKTGTDGAWCGSRPGLSFLSINLKCGADGRAEEAARALLDCLRRGSIRASANKFVRVIDLCGRASLSDVHVPQVAASEWESLCLAWTPERDSELLPHHKPSSIEDALMQAREWRNVYILSSDLIAAFPAPNQNITANDGWVPSKKVVAWFAKRLVGNTDDFGGDGTNRYGKHA